MAKNKGWKRYGALLTAVGLTVGLTAACGKNMEPQAEAEPGTEVAAETPSGAETLGLDLEFTARDLEVGYEETTATAVRFQGEAVTAEGDGAGITGTTVTISQEGTYVISGESENGRIIVNAGDNDKVQLILKGISLYCPNNSPIYIKNADKVFLTLEEGTENFLSDGAEYQLSEEDQKVDAVVYSKADLTVNGSGALGITAAYKHGIVSKDDLVITGGKLTVTAEGQGLYGKDCVKIKDGTFVLDTGGDGIQSDNAEDENRGFVYIAGGTFNITSQKDGIQAETVLRIDDGTFEIVSGGGAANAPAKEGNAAEGGRPGGGEFGAGKGFGGSRPKGEEPAASTTADSMANITADTAADTTEESKKGMKAGGELILNGGSLTVDSSDDSVHSNGSVTVGGGSYIIRTGDDGIHGEGAVVIDDGKISIEQSCEGIEGMTVAVNGGTISVVSSDDGFNAADGSSTGMGGRPGSGNENCFIRITGGSIRISASADGIDSNGDFYMDGGTLYIDGPESGGDSALDYDGEGVITGGTVIAVGSSGMAQGFSDSSSQNSVLYRLDSWMEAGTAVRLTDESGNMLAEYTPKKQYQSVVISVPELELGKTCILEAGEQKNEITITSAVTSNTRQMGGGIGSGGGRGPGGRGAGIGGPGGAEPAGAGEGTAGPEQNELGS